MGTSRPTGAPPSPGAQVAQNISSLTKKAQQRMYFLRQLKKFLLPVKMLVNSTLPSLNLSSHPPSQSVRRRAAKIAADPSHPGNELFRSLPSGKRLRSIKTRTSRHKNSFFPTAVSLRTRKPPPPQVFLHLLPALTTDHNVIANIIVQGDPV
ncbi:hypothetical protein QTP86_017612 [Hemibagrus guttatus]|nr:hypothetical protein QTP86_017612 [Hemibagrus guttatus]